MSEISGLGKLIEIEPGKKKFDNIEEARKAAETRKGNEAIVKNDDGTYSLFEISETKDQEKNVIAMAEKGNTAQFDPKLVEFSINGMFWDKSIRVENQSKEVKDINEVGTKISSTYLDNNKGKNKFQTEDQAIEAAKKHNGIEAVVKNADGTFSLYRATQEQMDKIMNDPNYNGKVSKFVLPQGGFLGLGSSESVVDVKKAAQPGSAPASEAPKMENVDFGKLKNVDFSKYQSVLGEYKFLDKALPKMAESPEFKTKLEALMKDPNVSNEVKTYANNALKALNEVISAMEAGKSPEELKAILAKKSGDDKAGDLIMDMAFMARYHDKNKYNSNAPSIGKIFTTAGEVEKELKAKTGLAEIPREMLFQEMGKKLGLGKSLNLDYHAELTDKKIESLKKDTGKIELDQGLLDFMSEHTSSVKNHTAGISGLEELNSLLDKMDSGQTLTVSDVEKLKAAYNNALNKMEDGSLNASDEQKASLKDMGKAFEIFDTKKAEYDKQVQNHNQSLDATKNNTQALITHLKELQDKGDLKPGEMRLLRSMEKTFGQYEQILNSGDPAAIALYGRYMEKILDFMENKRYESDPQGLKTLEQEYDNVIASLGSIEAGGSKDAAFETLKQYLGEHSEQAEFFKDLIYPPAPPMNYFNTPSLSLNQPFYSPMNLGGGYTPLITGSNLDMNTILNSPVPNYSLTGNNNLFGTSIGNPLSNNLFGTNIGNTGIPSWSGGGSPSLLNLNTTPSFMGSNGILGGSMGGWNSIMGGGLFGSGTGLFSGLPGSGSSGGGSSLSNLLNNIRRPQDTDFSNISVSDFASIMSSDSPTENFFKSLSASTKGMMINGDGKAISKIALDAATMGLSNNGYSAGRNILIQSYAKDSEESFQLMMAANAMKTDELRQVSEQLIWVADTGEAMLNLEVDASAADMTDLIQKFRDIIVKLDIDMRNAVKAKLEQIMVDQAIANSENAEKDMQKMLDNIKTTMDKLFDTSKEVNVGELSNEMKKAVLSGIVQFSQFLT